MKIAAIVLASALAGFVFGAVAVHRPPLHAASALPPARNPLNPKDVARLLGAVGIRHLSGRLELLPMVVMETDKAVVVRTFSSRRKRPHYVLIPKRDIKNIGEFTEADQSYMTDLLLTAKKIVEREKLSDYRLYTNGPGLQTVAYWHFHLIGKRG